MRLLILSEVIDGKERYTRRFSPPYDVQLDTGNLNDTVRFNFSIFDYDVSIIHVTKPQSHTIGYYENLPKILQDVTIALEHGRTVICLPQSEDFYSQRTNRNGMTAYEWLKTLGVCLQNNFGTDIKPSGAGLAQVIQDYLKYSPAYHQIVTIPQTTPQSTLAVVDDTGIVVGLEHQVGRGTLVVLPPPRINDDNYFLVMPRLVDVARRYYERGQRHISVGDVPPWIDAHLVPRAKVLADEIERLAAEKTKYDKIAYVLYGTGNELEDSVALLLGQLGLEVELQPQGANIDLMAKSSSLGIGFAVEITGTKGAIQKDSNKVSQAWQYLQDRAGTQEEKDKLVIVANTQYHLDPKERRRDSFSQQVIKLLGNNSVLLLSTLQLYELWKMVYEEQKKAEVVIQALYNSSGLFGGLKLPEATIG